MSITISGTQKRVGLALSGGGFRAAAFHLGVFKKLKALGLLDKIDLLSCVSGGSIAGGALAVGWKTLDAMLQRFEKYLKTRSIAVSSVVMGLLDPFQSRTDKLADSYDADLFEGAKLGSLESGPRVYFNTTNLATGNLFFITAGGGRGAEIGDHELGVETRPDFLVSRAVAASSSFPPVFPPLKLSPQEYPRRELAEYVTLTDGGVYDNLGVNPMLLDRNKLDYAIVSDAGAPFSLDATPNESGLGVMTVLIQILMEQVRGLQFDRLKSHHKSGSGPKPLFFSIDSIEGELQKGDAQLASAIGTNLKRLSDAEMDVLGRHGGALVEARIRKYAPELLLKP